ncbi:hypothetical protein LTR85_003846 [Meristemomyces frigidus]|nr:hypothetical protein LTR85_003846 [Meristemomyces frigidus]
MTPAIKLTSTTWTLRFKHHRSTVLLHVDPLQSLSSVRAELLKAVLQTRPDGTLNGHAIPDSEADVLLARPADINDLSLGWEPLDRDDDLADALEEEKSSSKGKGKAGASKTKAATITDCPQGAGLRDGGVVAFKFKSQQARVEGDAVIDIDEEGWEKLDEETLVGKPVPEKWDVVVPTLEETYREDGEEGDEDEIPVPQPKSTT